MGSLTATEHLEPFRLFCAEGKSPKSLRKRNLVAGVDQLKKRELCQRLYVAVVQVLLKLNTLREPSNDRQYRTSLPSSLLDLLGCLVSNDAETSSKQLSSVSAAYSKVAKTQEGAIDWHIDSDDARILVKAQNVFHRNLSSNEGLLSSLVDELKRYEAQLGGNSPPVGDNESTEAQARLPPVIMQATSTAQQVTDSMYGALKDITTPECICPILPRPHGYELRLPLSPSDLLPGQLPHCVLKLQMRRPQDTWQHTWITLASRSVPADVRHNIELCAQLSIASQTAHYLNFVLQEGKLYGRPLGHTLMAPEFATQARSLQSLVQAFPQLGEKMVRVVALKLALSAVYLCGGNWLQNIWNDDSVWFVERGENWIPPHPYLGTFLPIQHKAHICDSTCFGCVNQQKFPHQLQLVWLGVMLMEIRSGTTVKQFAGDYKLNPDYTMALARSFFDAFRRDMQEEEDYDYLGAVGACLNENFGMEDDKLLSIDELRKKILERIVGPLYKALCHYCPFQGDAVRALNDEYATMTDLGKHVEPNAYTHAAFIAPETNSANADDGGTFLKSSSSPSKLWFTRVDNLLAVMIPPQPEYSTYRRVKIAVLDTGFDSNDPLASKIQWMDWISKGSECRVDETGHGTNSVQLILHMYPDADLYIARVFKTNSANESNDPKHMAEAIIWAAQNEVDIISISAGFVNKKDEVLDAIKKARSIFKMDLLIFAAASNSGNRHGIAYPARHHDHVFCMFSCNGDHKETSLSNPSEDVYDPDNFAMLGEDVGILPGQVLHGSSISTALSAGFVARLVDFTRQQETIAAMKERGYDAAKIATRENIQAVFRKLSKPDGKYSCIAPEMLWQHGSEPGSRHPRREDVYKTLCDILRNG